MLADRISDRGNFCMLNKYPTKKRSSFPRCGTEIPEDHVWLKYYSD